MSANLHKSLHTDAHKTLITMFRQRRRELDLTQEALANLIGWPQWNISRIESGERKVDVVEFLILSKALQLDPHELINRITL